MNTIDFTKAGGFLLEQETLEMMQDSYAKDLFNSFKKQLGIKEAQNYSYKRATADAFGWISIQGELIPVVPATKITPYVEVKTIYEALVFGSGEHRKIYSRSEATHIDEIPSIVPQPIENDEERVEFSYHTIDTFLEVTHIQDLYKHLLPLDGSGTMRGDLHLGGHKISNLDVKEQELAKIRTAALFFGENALGKTISDQKNRLVINETEAWSKVVLHGKPNLTTIPENPNTHNHTLLIDGQGNISKSIGAYIGGIPLGLILAWNTDTPPYGWVWCDGNNGKTIQGISIPDLRAYAKGTTQYIIYVRYTNRPPEGLVIQGETQLTYTAQEGSASTMLIAYAEDPDGDTLNYNWTMLSGSTTISEVNTPKIELFGLTAGTYLFNVSASDKENLKVETIVTIEVSQVSTSSLSVNRLLTGDLLKIESYEIVVEGTPNEEIIFFAKMEENTSQGNIHIHTSNSGLLIDEKEFSLVLNADGKTSFFVSVGAGNTPGIIKGSIQIKGDDSSKVIVEAIQR
ncbi:PKD domain-containing protein [Tenacibaculum agarivorans]|uniref:PKD domain-containing protein n=1 Tax=Tenacibaculum agarivorans TaxID=1908389 RepID=UPI00094B906B|nr:hypothetical protein [Tenacibaculum agarivorans]